MSQWFLEGYLPETDARQHLVLDSFPVLIGRQEGLTLAGVSANMSRYHAELALRGGRLLLRDLGSRNGTFVNRERVVGEREISAGDVVHFADAEFRLGQTPHSETPPAHQATGIFRSPSLPQHFPVLPEDLETWFRDGRIAPLFQPIVRLGDGTVMAQECLARGSHDGLPRAPAEILHMAARAGRACEMSERMRAEGVAAAAACDLQVPLFVNIHPAEIEDLPRLLGHLAEVGRQWPSGRLVLELHEAAIPDLTQTARLADGLAELGIGLAYDDFGAGRARLMELVETPPDYLKFDRSLLKDIDEARPSQHRMLAMLVRYAREHGIVTLAEGITRPGEANTCHELGFDLAQGFLYGRPASPAAA